MRDRYGRHKYGQSLLLARRLVEAGVRLVTVYWGGRVNNPLPHWDTHFNNNRRLKEELLPPFDQCFSRLPRRPATRAGCLAARWWSAWASSAGRRVSASSPATASMRRAATTGRSAIRWLLAGGPAGGGRVIGRSDRFAAYPADEPYTPQDLGATVLHALGVNPAEEVRDAFGRKVPLSTGQVRKSLLGA